MVADACNALLVLWVRVWLRGDSPWAMVREAQGRSADRVPRVCATSSWSGICGATASGLKRCPLGDRYRIGDATCEARWTKRKGGSPHNLV